MPDMPFTFTCVSVKLTSPTEMAEDGITAYTFLQTVQEHFAFVLNLSSIFTANHHFCIINIYSRPF